MQGKSLNRLESPTFILGTQRSGTTLLTRILSTHPRLFIQNELPLQTIFSNEIDKTLIIKNIEQHFINRYKKNIPDYLSLKDKTHWGLKDPQLTEHLDALKLFLPDSKFIVIIRDPRGVVNSYIENKWGLGTNAYSGAMRWNEEVNLQIDFCRQFPDNVVMLKFEDLVSDLEGSLKIICHHIDVKFDRKMLEYHKTKFEYTMNKQNENITRAPDSNIKNKWKNELTTTQINNIEFIAKDTMERLNYPLITKAKKPNRISEIWFRLHQLVIGEMQIQYQLKLAPRLKRWKRKASKVKVL